MYTFHMVGSGVQMRWDYLTAKKTKKNYSTLYAFCQPQKHPYQKLANYKNYPEKVTVCTF